MPESAVPAWRIDLFVVQPGQQIAAVERKMAAGKIESRKIAAHQVAVYEPETGPVRRVHLNDVTDPHLLVLPEALHRIAQPVVRRDDLDDQERRIQHNAIGLAEPSCHDDDIGYAIPGLLDPGAALRPYRDPELLLEASQVHDQYFLKSAMIQIGRARVGKSVDLGG